MDSTTGCAISPGGFQGRGSSVALSGFQGGGDPQALLADAARRRAAGAEVSVEAGGLGVRLSAAGRPDSEIDLPDPQPGPEQTAEARSALAQLDRVLCGLPFRHRCVLFDLYAAGESRAQVARTYGLSLGTLDTLVRQARERYIDVMAAPKPRTHRHRPNGPRS